MQRPPHRPALHRPARPWVGILRLALSVTAGLVCIASIANSASAQGPTNELAEVEVDWSAIGFSKARVREQLAIERTYVDSIPKGSFEKHLLALTKEPHVAGTEANERVAEYIKRTMSDAGLEVQTYPYDIYMPRAETATNSVEIVRPKREPLNQQEDIFDLDAFTEHPANGPGWNAYSASGDVTGEVVYANYGRREDYQRLAKLKVDLTGKIVLARYGGNFRGYKAKYAEEAGAAGLLIFSDPADGGYTQGLVYPEGKNLNDSTVQRGSILTLDWTGDPLTPFEPAWPQDHPSETVVRKDPSTVGLPKIPVTPLPHASAKRILEQMTGAAAPRDWQGGLPLPYRLIGGDHLQVRVRVHQDRELTRVANVVGSVRGSRYPEEWIILGSHFDAWGFGALDPNGGTAMLLSLAEALGELVRKGQRPLRSILIAHWDAEEFGILGSAEWVEQMRSELDAKAVAYINADGAVTGSTFSVSAAPALKGLLRETAKAVLHPAGGTIHSNWVGAEGNSAEPFSDLGGGSDHVGFASHIGIPSAMIGFSGSAPVYHSVYDTFTWFARFADPTWQLGPALTELDGLVALRLANADLLPFDFESFAEDSSRHLAVTERLAGTSFRHARIQLRALLNASARLAKVRRRALESSTAAGRSFAAANTELIRVERLFVVEEGLPFGAWYRSLFASPDPTSGYAPWMYPGLRWAAEQNSIELLEEWEAVYADALNEVAQAADRIAQHLR